MELTEKITQELHKVDSHIESLEAKAAEQAKLNGEVQEEIKTELKKSQELYTEIKERLDRTETEFKRLGAGEEATKSFGQKLRDAIQENHEAIKGYKSTGRFQMEIKDAVTMNTGDSLTGEVIAPTRVPGFFHDPDRQVHVRQFLQTASTDSDSIRYVVESGYEDGTNVTGEGSLKPKSSLELEAKIAPVIKIATHMKVSEEMLDDVAGLAGYLTTRGTSKYRLKEDSQLLYGTGQNGQIEGLTVAATAFSGILTGDAKNEYDVALDALAQLAQREYMASGIMINPKRWYNLLRAKDAEQRYILPDAVRFGLTPPQIDGVPIIANTAVAADDFLIANFAQMATLYDRRSVNVRFYDQNEDDAIKNLVTVVIEGRLALPIYLPNASVYGDFTEVITS
jgi:HK97 family phage major capsid protein